MTTSPKIPPKGSHIICEFGGCQTDHLANIEFLKDVLLRAVEAAGGTPIGVLSHQFDDGGATIVVGLQESHISIHTWPDEGYVSSDVYTCGDSMKPEVGMDVVASYLQPANSKTVRIRRGADMISQDWIHDEGLPYATKGIRAEFLGKCIYEGDSSYQHIEVYETEALGRVLRLDRIIQTSEKYGFIYDEAIGAVAALLRPNPKQAFVIGGGDLGTLRVLLSLRSIEKVIVSEIDEAVVEISKEYLPSIPAGSFDDPRAEIVARDAMEELRRYEDAFDIIISDLTDPIPDSPAEQLFETEFFELVKKSLKPDGIFSVQSGLLYFQSGEVKTVIQRLRSVFEYVQVLGVPVPMYGIGPFTFIYASSQPLDLPLDELKAHYQTNLEVPLRYFTPEIYFYAKNLPPFTQQELGLMSVASIHKA